MTTATPTFRPGSLVCEREAAAILGCSVATLRNWRWKSTGPRFRKIGDRLVRYLVSDLEEFVGCEVK